MGVSPDSRDPRARQIGRLFDHLAWADLEIARAITRSDAPADAVREFAHIAGAEEIWLSRIEHRAAAVGVWPDLNASDAADLARRTAAAFKELISGLHDAALDSPVRYVNSAGKAFATPLSDILLHVALHGQYHRGKVNALLRLRGVEPAPVDFIGFVRGSPAAVTTLAQGRS